MSDLKKPQIYSAMAAIMSEITAIAKEGRNPIQGYNFRGIDQVYNALHPLLAKHKVFLTFSVGELTREERPTKQKGVWVYSTLRVTYRFTAEDGSFVETLSMGEGADTGDKSINKAMSAAQKYAFFQMFCIPTLEEGMIDSEKDSPQFETQKQSPKKPNTISEAQRKRLYAITNNSEFTQDDVKKMLKEDYGFESSKDITWQKYEEICHRIENPEVPYNG